MYSLAPSVRACVDQNVVVFLDLKRDRYFSIDAAASPPIGAVIAGGNGGATEALVAKGLIDTSRTAAPVDTLNPAILTSELPDQAYRQAEVAWTDWVSMLVACVRAERSMRSRRLDLAFSSFHRRKQRQRRKHASLGDDVARFELMRPWYPRARVCLYDSLALMNFLIARGHAPLLVMGVRAGPFAAHCWVESEATSLNDVAESCRSYTPIAWV